jgi:hypothetical protein
MNDDYKLKAYYTKILTAKDLADRFSSDIQFKSKYKALSTSTLYNLLETLVSNNYISYNYLQNVLPNHYSIENSSETEFILSDYPFTSSFTYFDSYGRYVTLESTSSVNLTMKKTSSDTNVLDLEYPSNKTFILYTFGTKRYNANRDTEGTIFYYFTDEHNPIVDGKCIIISNNKSSGLSKAVGELPSSEDRTDSFLDPHANNLVYKSDNLVSYDKVVYVMPPSEITTTTGTTAFTQDSEARTFTAVGAINGEDPVTYENVITLTADVKNILIYSVGSLIGDVGPADQIAQISITDISGTTSQILNTRGCSENLINTGPLTSGSKLTLTYTSGTYEPSNAQQVFTLEYYTETVTDASLQDFISSKVTHESTDRRQMDMILQKNIDAQYSDLQTQIFDLQGHVIENMLDAVIFRLSNLDNKSEFRFFGPSNSGVTDLGLSFEDVSLTSGDKFEMSATFQTASSGCTFEITESTSVKVKLTGDDVTNGVLSPVANKVYEIAFYWNGLFMSGVVRGVEHEAVDTRKKITITNMTKTDFSPDLYVFSDEGCTNIIGTLEAWGGSQEFAVDGNLIYAGYKKTDAASILANSSSGCTPTLISNSTYHAYKIEITSSPASIDLRGK